MYSDRNPYLSLMRVYRRYIEDCLIIWGGEENQLKKCVDYMDDNPHNLKFTSEIDDKEIVFLDLIIFIDGEKLKSKTRFKNVPM